MQGLNKDPRSLLSVAANLHGSLPGARCILPAQVCTNALPVTLVQALILHVQHFIIITRPPVDYPRTITAATAVLSALTWAGDWWGFSPACLLPNQDSAGQARLVLAGGLLVPCAVLLASLALWAVRCVGQGVQWHVTALGALPQACRTRRALQCCSWEPLAPCVNIKSYVISAYRYRFFRRPVDPPQQLEQASPEATYHDLSCTATLFSGCITATAALMPDGDDFQGTSELGGQHTSPLGVPVSREGAVLVLASQASCPTPLASDLQRASTHDALGSPTTPTDQKLLASAQTPSARVTKSERLPLSTRAVEAPPEQLAPCGAGAGLLPLSPEAATVSAYALPRRRNAPLSSAFSTSAAQAVPMAYQQQQSHSASQEEVQSSFRLNMSPQSSAAKLAVSAKSKALTLRTATSSALAIAGRTLSRLVPAPKPTSALAHADRSMSLAAQLGIVMWVAVFVLYPSWLQAALSVFACYVIDDGSGPYGENQKVH